MSSNHHSKFVANIVNATIDTSVFSIDVTSYSAGAFELEGIFIVSHAPFDSRVLLSVPFCRSHNKQQDMFCIPKG